MIHTCSLTHVPHFYGQAWHPEFDKYCPGEQADCGLQTYPSRINCEWQLVHLLKSPEHYLHVEAHAKHLFLVASKYCPEEQVWELSSQLLPFWVNPIGHEATQASGVLKLGHYS